MNNVRINNEINLTYPDGFNEMSAEELTRYFSSPENRWGVYDPENHIILSVSWTKLKFPRSLSDAETLTVDIESRMRRSLLNYQRVTSYHTKTAPKKGYGIRFEYRVKDSVRVHVADLVVFKNKGKLYKIHYISRKANAAACRPAFQEVLNSVTVG